MNKHFVIAILSSLIFMSCKKLEGEGGRSSIIGQVHMTDESGNNQGEYYLPDARVYIIYGDESETANDDTRTSYDGSFAFENLRPGNYTVFAYSEDDSEPSGLNPVFKYTVLGKKEIVDIGTIELEK